MATSWKSSWLVALLGLPICAQSHSPAIIIDPSTVPPAPARTIPADLLRYPLSGKALHMLQKALQTSEAGDHAEAIQQMRRTLLKYPGTGAYVFSLLGAEYLKTGQIPEAIDALEQAVTFLPHDASNHANLGLALVCKGQYDRAESELKRALDLDRHNRVASQLLDALANGKDGQK